MYQYRLCLYTHALYPKWESHFALFKKTLFSKKRRFSPHCLSNMPYLIVPVISISGIHLKGGSKLLWLKLHQVTLIRATYEFIFVIVFNFSFCDACFVGWFHYSAVTVAANAPVDEKAFAELGLPTLH